MRANEQKRACKRLAVGGGVSRESFLPAGHGARRAGAAWSRVLETRKARKLEMVPEDGGAL